MEKRYFLFSIVILCLNLYVTLGQDEEMKTETQVNDDDDEYVIYSTPHVPSKAYLAETFDDITSFERKWVKSIAKKDSTEESLAKYDGVWSIENLVQNSLVGDRGLVLKSKAKHAAISAPLLRPFVFKDKPLILQYEINLQNGQECGGSYIKLLSSPKTGKLNLKEFQDKTPYTIMFGPDKCGNDFKYHFIFRHVNPLNNSVEEKHCKRPDKRFDDIFKDKKTHLHTLILKPDGSFEVLVDKEMVNSGHLLEDFTPPVNPEKEIDDPEDFKPEDWDEREKIPDPTALKPDDWDEDAPEQIVDQSVSKPRGWLDNEPELIPDPDAVMPDDWDSEMDGDWEAALVNNPKCGEAPGCGEWKPPMIDNPNFKGKWIAPMIDNPNYRGKWYPRRIPNPDYFEDLQPFKMTTISAVGFELWSMSDDIYFDNILITDDKEEAEAFTSQTFDLKTQKAEKGERGLFSKIIDFSNKHPWIHGVYVLLAAVPVVLIYMCCCGSSDKKDEDALRKKTDEPAEDDPKDEEDKEPVSDKDDGEEPPSDKEDKELASDKEDKELASDKEDKELASDKEDKELASDKEDREQELASDKEEEEVESTRESPRTSPRLRNLRKE